MLNYDITDFKNIVNDYLIRRRKNIIWSFSSNSTLFLLFRVYNIEHSDSHFVQNYFIMIFLLRVELKIYHFLTRGQSFKKRISFLHRNHLCTYDKHLTHKYDNGRGVLYTFCNVNGIFFYWQSYEYHFFIELKVKWPRQKKVKKSIT